MRSIHLGVVLILVAGSGVTAHPGHDLKHTANFGMSSTDGPVCKYGFTDRVSPEQQKIIDRVMGSRHMRLIHALWHTGRARFASELAKGGPGSYRAFGLVYGQQWVSPHVDCPMPDNDADDPDYNPVGEDFLFMHRTMIWELRQQLSEAGFPCIKSWKKIPAPDDPIWPMPTNQRSGVYSDQTYLEMKSWERAFSDPRWLRGHSLSQLGFFIERTIHGRMHGRWADPKVGERFLGTDLPEDGRFPPDWNLDDPSNNYLGDPYSSAVNPVFWKLHGLIDDLIGKWLSANGYDEIAVDCGERPQCYAWRGTWVGGTIESRFLKSDPAGVPLAERKKEALAQARHMLDLKNLPFTLAETLSGRTALESVLGATFTKDLTDFTLIATTHGLSLENTLLPLPVGLRRPFRADPESYLAGYCSSTPAPPRAPAPLPIAMATPHHVPSEAWTPKSARNHDSQH